MRAHTVLRRQRGAGGGARRGAPNGSGLQRTPRGRPSLGGGEQEGETGRRDGRSEGLAPRHGFEGSGRRGELPLRRGTCMCGAQRKESTSHATEVQTNTANALAAVPRFVGGCENNRNANEPCGCVCSAVGRVPVPRGPLGWVDQERALRGYDRQLHCRRQGAAEGAPSRGVPLLATPWQPPPRAEEPKAVAAFGGRTNNATAAAQGDLTRAAARGAHRPRRRPRGRRCQATAGCVRARADAASQMYGSVLTLPAKFRASTVTKAAKPTGGAIEGHAPRSRARAPQITPAPVITRSRAPACRRS